MRHAKSSWKDPELPDAERPLTKRGRRDAELMARLLSSRKLAPELVLCSIAKRAQQTADLVVKHSPFNGDVFFLNELYQSSVEQYLSVLSERAGENTIAMIIGHNPEMEEFLRSMCAAREEMATATIACIQFDLRSWSNLTKSVKGKLTNVWRPKEIA